MSTLRKISLTLVVAGVVAGCAAFATFSAFSSTTTNSGNTFDTGTVAVSDNDAGSAMYHVTGALPGQTFVKCIHVTYTGSLPADVKLYTTSTFNAGAGYVDLTVEAGTGGGAFPDCTGFTPDGAPIYTGTLGDFASAHPDWAGGVAAYPATQSEWDTNDSVTYRFTLGVQNDDAAQGWAIAAHSFTWEAQNQ